MNAFANDASKKPCTKSEAMQAEKEVDFLSDWDHLYRSYRRFSQCDDGSIGEGYSDAVGKLLANDSGQLNRLLTLTKTDTGFQRFVVKHIDETLPVETLQKISNNARSSCPAGAEKLCSLIGSAASGKSPAAGSKFRIRGSEQLKYPPKEMIDEVKRYADAHAIKVSGPPASLTRMNPY